MEQDKVASAIASVKPLKRVLGLKRHPCARRQAKDGVETLQTGKSDLGHQPDGHGGATRYGFHAGKDFS